VLYRLDRLQGQHGCAIVEGEKDANNLTEAGLLATTSVFGSGAWRHEYALQLVVAGIRFIVIFPDNDAAGEKYAQEVLDFCLQAGLLVNIVHLPGLPPRAT
jgi:putative DNA primase/helicase